MSFLEKIRQKPVWVRKLIVWIVVITLGLGLVVWWLINISKSINSFRIEDLTKKIDIPSFEEKIKELESKSNIPTGESLINTVSPSDVGAIK